MLGCVVGTQPSLEGQGGLPGGSKGTTVIVTITIITLPTWAEYSLHAGQGIKDNMGHIFLERLYFSPFTDVETEVFRSPSHIAGR